MYRDKHRRPLQQHHCALSLLNTMQLLTVLQNKPPFGHASRAVCSFKLWARFECFDSCVVQLLDAALVPTKLQAAMDLVHPATCSSYTVSV